MARNKLSEQQIAYADAIVNAGLAPREEVEAAFRDGSQGNVKIDAWGEALRQQNREIKEQSKRDLASEIRWEPCAYPGCTEKVKVHIHAFGKGNEYPQPARIISLTCDMPGWREVYQGKKKVRIPNTDVQVYRLYACSPQHAEGIFRLNMQVSFTIDEQEEQRIRSIRYPVGVSTEASTQIMWLARDTAKDIVAQAGLEEQLAQTRAQMQAIAREQIARLLKEAEQEAEQLTDDLEKFSKHYIQQFVLGYKAGLDVRASILKGREVGPSVENGRWMPLCALLENQREM